MNKIKNAPVIGSVWIRKDTKFIDTFYYKVLYITNVVHSSPKHPPQVVYQGSNNHIWSMPLLDWPGKLKLKKGW